MRIRFFIFYLKKSIVFYLSSAKCSNIREDKDHIAQSFQGSLKLSTINAPFGYLRDDLSLFGNSSEFGCTK